MNDNKSDPNIVRVVNEFKSEFEGELSVGVNEIIQIEYKLDKYWFFGKCNANCGKIPVINCREISIEEDIDFDKYSLFAANNDFYNDCIEGDLRFKKGDLIIGFEPIDENWWSGCLFDMRESSGIFPLTHVWKLDSNLLPKKVKSNEQTFNVKFAKVLMDMKSQLENEIDLTKGEVIKITGNFDKMYFKGESLDGKRCGIFPKSFVKILEDFQPIHVETNEENIEYDSEVNDGSDNPPSYENVISSTTQEPLSLGYNNSLIGEVESYGRTLFPFKAEFPNELSLKENEIVHLIRHIDNEWTEGEIDGKVGIFPKSFIEIIVDCELNKSDQNANIPTICEEFPADSFARVLYDFEGEVEGDLRVRKGDTLTLIRRIDNNWLEAMDDCGNVGFVGQNHCEIIDDITSNSSMNSRSISTITETSDETVSIPENGFNSIDLNSNLDTTSVNIKEFDPICSTPNHNLSVIDGNIHSSSLSPKTSPKIPRRPAPAVPQTPQTIKSQQEVSPQRPPPPVPKHRSQRRRSIKINDSNTDVVVNGLNQFNRQESIRSSITSNSSSSSAKSDTASGLTTTVPSAEELLRLEERKKKVREQRGCVIMELLQTERDYKQNLIVCKDIFIKNREETKANGIDVNLLFGNLEEIIDVSTHLIRLLEENTSMKKYEHQRVGKCFIQISEDMKKAYSYYCKNHDSTQPLWQKYEAQSDAKQYLQKGLDRMREETNCFDIPSVLIKPVQRILKYPLLLNELYKCTEDGHEDRNDLLKAQNMITDMATDINEFKRRQDLVLKYRKESSNSFSSRFSKLNLHTVIKKSSRLGHRISSTFGLTTITKDEEYIREVRKFRAVEKTIKIFVKDQQLFMKSLQEFLKQGLAMIESIADYYASKNRQIEVEQLRTTHREIVGQYLKEFHSAIERDVTPVLNKLLTKFSGPNKLINKREDKLLDYDSYSKKMECNKDQLKQKTLQDQQLLAKNTYEALNRQLLEELPKLCEISVEILEDCIQAFLIARKKLIARIAKHHLSLLDLPLVMGFTAGSSADINETFHIKHNLVIDQLLDEISILPPNIFPNRVNSTGINASLSASDINRKHSTRSSRRSLQLNNVNYSVVNNTIGFNDNKRTIQSPSQRAYLQSRYNSNQLYESTKSYDAIDLLDIYLNNGDLVGIIKRQDPMGSSHRWFVDTGCAQGFVPSNILIPYHDDSWVKPPSDQSINIQTKQPKNAMDFTTNTTTTPIVEHHYKLHPSPTPPLLRNDLEVHRYEEVAEDSPPRYSKLDMSDTYQNLLSFDENEEKSNSCQQYYNFGEFDPLYSSIDSKSLSPSVSSPANHRYEEIAENCVKPELKSCEPKAQESAQPIDLYFAAYPFSTCDKNQLSLEFGQPVSVIHKSDLTGNSEWWYCEDKDGNMGYVPANYLSKHKSKSKFQ